MRGLRELQRSVQLQARRNNNIIVALIAVVLFFFAPGPGIASAADVATVAEVARAEEVATAAEVARGAGIAAAEEFAAAAGVTTAEEFATAAITSSEVPMASGEYATPGAPFVLTLSEALVMAQRHGPGFAQARLQTRSRELDSALADARKSPVLTVTGRTHLQPEPGQSVTADVQWDFHDNFTLEAAVGRRWRPDTSPVGRGSDDSLSLSFRRQLWPKTDEALDDRIDALEDRIVGLDESRSFYDAHVAVVEAFGALDEALRAEATAGAQLELAIARTRITEAAFAVGERGLKQLQDAQKAEREALVARRNAATARAQAALRLQRLLGDTSMDKLRDAMESVFWPSPGPEPESRLEFWDDDSGASTTAPRLSLHDDLAWSPFIDEVRAVLTEAGDDVFEWLLASDTTYLNVKLAELRAVVARDTAANERGLQWNAEAAYTVPLSGSASGSAPVSPGGSGPGSTPSSPAGTESGSPSGPAAVADGGTFTAFVGASWTWDAAGGIRVEQAELALTSAEMRTRAARQTALDEAAAALRAIDDAAFAKDVAEMGLEQALATLELIERRAELGFAAPLELTEARLDVERARAELIKAQSVWYGAWLEVGRRLGLSFPSFP